MKPHRKKKARKEISKKKPTNTPEMKSKVKRPSKKEFSKNEGKFKE
jgi:hypothetical protein